MNRHQETQPYTQYLAVYKVYHTDFKGLELYGGQHPSSYDKNERLYKIEELTQLGITTSICLMQDHEIELFAPYKDDILKINQGFKWLHYPILDMFVPEKAFMKQILDHLDQLIAQEEKIYVHCLGGHGRTGTVIGCWLKRYGIKNQEVYLKLAQWRVQTLFGKTSSPQTAEQFTMIKNWQKGE